MVEKLVFDHTIEGLFLRGLAGQVTPQLREKLRQAGVDLDQRLHATYPFHTWVRCIDLAAGELFPTLPEPEAWQLLGERLVEGYQRTSMGGALFMLIQALGPRRGLARTERGFRSGNNYTEVRCKDVAPTVVEMWVNETAPLCHFVRGMLLAGMRASGAPKTIVDILEVDARGTTYRIAWREERDQTGS